LIVRRLLVVTNFLVVITAGAAAVAEEAPPRCGFRLIAALEVSDVQLRSVRAVPATSRRPGYCAVEGSVATVGDGATPGSARFLIELPDRWNGKFLFWGSPGLGGPLPPSANPVDLKLALSHGYATAWTDLGHDGFDPGWILAAPHRLDRGRLVDFWYRAAHAVTVAGKSLVARFYRTAIDRAYFDGCSNGGRMGLMEAMRYPDDYDGVIAGAPWLDLRAQLAGYKNVEALSTQFTPRPLLALVDRAVLRDCDAKDGATDGLIQNPAQCNFDPASLVCRTGHTGGCLSPGQVAALSTYLGAVRDNAGHMVFPGQPVGDFAAEGGLMPEIETQPFAPDSFPLVDVSSIAAAWFLTRAMTRLAGPSAPDFVREAPSEVAGLAAHYLGRLEPPFAWVFADWALRYLVFEDPEIRLDADRVERRGVVDDDLLRRFDRAIGAGNADRPARLGEFLARGGKIILYHGFSDPVLSPFRTILFYQDLARRLGGYAAAREEVRLFMVPGMLHCGGGDAPDRFDTLSALEAWVENGTAPDRIVASRSGRAAARLGPRSIPLCAYPGAARYDGRGSVDEAKHWRCTGNRDLLRLGHNGREAGLAEQQYAPGRQ
jgi:Tannase and feruloyl esterase